MKSFKSHIRMEEKSLGELTFGQPSARHYRIMNKSHDLLPVESATKLVEDPPKNDSDEVRLELMELKDRLELESDTEEKLEKWDIDLLIPFVKYLKSNDLEYDKEQLDNLVNDSTVVILKQKYLFDRPRPKQVASSMKISLPVLKSDTANTPAYPSGHTTQSRLIALYLSGKHRDHSKSFLDLAEECGQSRLDAGIHYPTDHEAGVELGNKLYASMVSEKKGKLKYKDLPAHVYGMEGY